MRHGGATEPYILISRGDEFADSFDAPFFAKTFPTLFPLGRGGPRQAEECVMVTEGDGHWGLGEDTRPHDLVSSRNMTLERWAALVLQRHGGRFATYPVFAFLVFNIGIRSRNRCVSMASVTKKDFADVERVVRSLTAARIESAKVELEASGKTRDKDVNQLLRSLSLYRYRQPMSRESRLAMRRKIKSLIARYGIPAIWFTLNPNRVWDLFAGSQSAAGRISTLLWLLFWGVTLLAGFASSQSATGRISSHRGRLLMCVNVMET